MIGDRRRTVRSTRAGLATWVAGALLLAACSSGGAASDGGTPADNAAPAPTATSGEAEGPNGDPAAGDVIDETPDPATVDAGEPVSVFRVTFDSPGDGARHGLLSSLFAKDDVSDRLFVGQTLMCTSPSGKAEDVASSGENIYPDDDFFPIYTQGILTAKEAGEWTCESRVRVCEPGNCDEESGGAGSVSFRVGKPATWNDSFFYATSALPDWVDATRMGQRELLIDPGDTGVITTEIGVNADVQQDWDLYTTLSVSSCIVPAYPTECAEAAVISPQVDALVRPSVTVTQKAENGATCATATLGAEDGVEEQVITWEKHHINFALLIPDFTPSTDPGCLGTAIVDVRLEVVEGISVVVERGTANRPKSIVSLVPSIPIELG